MLHSKQAHGAHLRRPSFGTHLCRHLFLRTNHNLRRDASFKLSCMNYAAYGISICLKHLSKPWIPASHANYTREFCILLCFTLIAALTWCPTDSDASISRWFLQGKHGCSCVHLILVTEHVWGGWCARYSGPTPYFAQPCLRQMLQNFHRLCSLFWGFFVKSSSMPGDQHE